MSRFRASVSDPRRFGKRSIGKLSLILLLQGLAPVALSGAARAQLMLPGATNGASGEAAPRTAAGPVEPRPPAKPIAVKPPGEEAVLGHPLAFDGIKGMMQFDRSGNEVKLTKLTLPGERLSKPGQTCQVDLVALAPIVAAEIGRPAGALRWSVDAETCPFAVDVLDGAVLASSARQTCDFAAADCRVSAIGLWGPTAESFSPQRIKDLEHARVRDETTMRANFRVLLHRAGKNKAAVKSIAGEQAAFSSEREVTCRDYRGEAAHGFCSAQITTARSLAIAAKFAEAGDDPKGTVHRVAKKPARPKPAGSTPPAPADDGAPAR